MKKRFPNRRKIAPKERDFQITKSASMNPARVLSDTNSCLLVIPVKRRKISIFHMDVDNCHFERRVSGDASRRIVDPAADVKLTCNPMFDVLLHFLPRIDASCLLARLEVQAGSYFVVSVRREENIQASPRFSKLEDVLSAVAEGHNLPVIMSTHPRTQKCMDATGGCFHQQARLFKSLGFRDYVELQLHAGALRSDSGTINEESLILNFSELNLLDARELPEGMEETSGILVGWEMGRVRQGLYILARQPQGDERTDRHGIRPSDRLPYAQCVRQFAAHHPKPRRLREPRGLEKY